MKNLKPKGADLYLSRIPCGFPSPADDYLEMRLSLDEYVIKRESSTFFARSEGQSMEPLIFEGDLVTVDRSISPRSGDVVLCILDGEFCIKRFVLTSKGGTLVSENKKYKDIYVDQHRDFSIWGVVTFVIHEFKR